MGHAVDGGHSGKAESRLLAVTPGAPGETATLDAMDKTLFELQARDWRCGAGRPRGQRMLGALGVHRLQWRMCGTLATTRDDFP